MSNLTLLEMTFVWYMIAVNVLGIVNVFLMAKAPRKVGETFLFITLVLAIPILSPFVVYYTFENIAKSKRKNDLEKKYDEFFNNKGVEK